MDNNIPSAPLLPGHGAKPPKPDPVAEDEEALEEPDVLNEHVKEPGDPDGVLAAETVRRDQTSSKANLFPARKKRRWPIVLLVIILLAVAVVASYWYGTKKANAPATKQSSATKTTQKKAAETPVATKHYDSETYTLGLDYPGNWTISDTAERLQVQSPSSQFTIPNGSKSNGRILVSIQSKQSTVPGFPEDGAVAALNSDKLTYKQPSEAQRAQTYLSYVGFKSQNDVDRLFLTGDSGYQKGQLVPLGDVTKGNPLVSVAFMICTTNDCVVPTSPQYMALKPDAWQASEAAKQVLGILESLQFN